MTQPENRSTSSEAVRKHKEFLSSAVASYYQQPVALVKCVGQGKVSRSLCWRTAIQVKVLIGAILIVLFTTLLGSAQTLDGSEYRTYAEAMADGKKWQKVNNTVAAEKGFKRATELAKTETEKIDAMLAHAAVLSDIMDDSKRYKRADESYFIYREVLSMPKLPPARADEVRLAFADMVMEAVLRGCCLSPTLKAAAYSDTKLGLREFARAEYGKVIDAASATPTIRVKSRIGRAKTYETTPVFGSINKDAVMAAATDLRAAGEIAGAPDADKATAYFAFVELAQLIQDGNSVAGGFDAITKLPAATPAQKTLAYKGLIELMLGNNLVKPAREKLVEANKVAGLEAEHKAVLIRLSAVTILYEGGSADAAAAAANMKTAIAEVDKTVAGLTADEKYWVYMASGEYFQNIPVAVPLALDQLKKAVLLPKLDEDKKAEAQYAIGETYRINAKYAEAKAEYSKVSNVNKRYYNYAQKRITEVESLMASPAKTNK